MKRLTDQAGEQRDISQANLPLAGYLLIRNALDRTVDQNDAGNLLHGQKTLTTTRLRDGDSCIGTRKKTPLQQDIIATGIGKNLGLSTKEASEKARENFASASVSAENLIGFSDSLQDRTVVSISE